MVLPGSSIGRYLVKRKLAEGGMAELYLAAAMGPEGFEKEVVIKRIKAFLSGDPSFIEMFKAEARLASRLNHANVVQIFDFDKHEDAWFIAMEYVYGASLWELRRRCRELAVPLPPVLVAEIGAQVARGLHYAHTLTEKGKPLQLVHRDVTPHNVLMSFDGGVKLTDFGIAKAGTSFTAPGMLKGKFAYMSPEQARGEKVDARTDVFAMGITLWEMLTGGRLFEGDSEMAVLRAVQESLIAPPSRLNPDVPPELSEIVMKALSRPVEQRFQTAHELDRALATFVLKNAASPEDTNVGLFLRQMFKDELEEAERALANPQPTSDPAEPSRTPVVDAYALGNTKQVNRVHDPPTQQTATPLPSAPPPIGPAPQKTAEMPGQRRSRPLPPLPEGGGPPAQRTEQMNEVGGAPRESTAQQPGVRPSRKLVPLPELAPALAVPETAKTEPRGMDATVPGRAPAAAAAPALGGQSDTDLEAHPRPKSRLGWIIAAAVVAGVIAGLAFTVDRNRATPPAPPVAAVVEVPAIEPVAPRADEVPAPAPPPAPEPVVAAAPIEAPPVEPVAAKPAVVAAKGSLTIDAVPYGLVYINNAKVSEVSGTRVFPLAPGTYAVRISHTRQDLSETVVIKAGKNQTLTFRPLAAPAK